MKKLTAAEERVMRYYWQTGPSLVSQIIDLMPDPKPAQTTISTLTRSLEAKGYLDHKSYGRTYEYYPIISQEEYSQSRLGKMVNELFQDSPHALISCMVRNEQIDINELKALINQLEAEKEKS